MKAILTGHTRGLGAAIASALLARGIPLLAVARQRNETLGQEFPGLIEQEVLDLGDLGQLQTWLSGERLRTFCQGADTLLLINNAGVLGPMGALHAQDVAGIAGAVSLNVAAPLMISSALAGLHPGALRILHISSGAARDAYPGWSVYCATKAALDHHARAVKLDARANLKVCSLAPGVVDTAMQAEIRSVSAEQFPLQEKFLALKREGKLSPPDEVAGKLMTYLLSDAFGSEAVADLRHLTGF